MIVENGIFTLGRSFEEVGYSQLMKLILPDSLFVWRMGVKGMSRNCCMSSKPH